MNKTYEFTERKYDINEVLIHYTKEKSEKDFDGYLVKMDSQRYETFLKCGSTCVTCNREGTHFRLQRPRINTKNSGRYHFGLWSDDDVQMTKDHILPKSKGGKNHISNYQTMCKKCNEKKGNKY